MGLIWGIFLLFVGRASADTLTPIVVSAARQETALSDTPQSLSIIDDKYLARNKNDLVGSFRDAPGVAVSSSGAPGQPRSVFIRGAKAEHTLVLVDGIPLNDPLSPSRAFDFSLLPQAAIEHVEILRGPQSVLYGTDAMGGVINIYTDKISRAPRFELGGGSYGTKRLGFSAYGFHSTFFQTNGFSAADSANGNTERDGSRYFSLGGSKEYRLGENTLWHIQAYGIDRKCDTDAAGGANGDTFGTYSQLRQILFLSDYTHLSTSGIEWRGSVVSQIQNRDDNTLGPAYFRSQNSQVDQSARKTILNQNASIGISYQLESGRSSDLGSGKKSESAGIYVQDYFVSGPWHSNLGWRMDKRFHGPTQGISRATTGLWLVPDRFRIKSSLGQGYKYPSLYQLYSNYGNLRLNTEKSWGWDFGWEFVWEDTLRVEWNWYQNRFRNLIDFDYITSKYNNSGRAETKGWEWASKLNLSWLYLKNNFTFTDARDSGTGLRLLRRPRMQGMFEIGREQKKWSWALQIFHTGVREDIHPSLYTRQKMPSHSVLESFLKYDFSHQGFVQLEVKNLLDRVYQDVSGYGTARRTFFLTLNYQK